MEQSQVRRGGIYLCNFGSRPGSIQSGRRPVLVLQADDFNRRSSTTVVAALTTAVKKQFLPSHIVLGPECGLDKPSMVLLEQMTTISQSELGKQIGSVADEEVLTRIARGLKKTFGMWIYRAAGRSDVRCLCPKCLKDYMADPDIIVRRLQPLDQEKGKCDKCDGYGYDYVIVQKRKPGPER
jgi:mRNA interferase MazF